MLRYILKRIIWVIPVMLGVIAIVFSITYFTPGDPVAMMLGVDYSQEAYDAKTAELGLDRPFIVQLADYIWKLVTKLEFGSSYITKFPIKETLLARIPISMKLSLMGMCLMIIIGLPLGMLQALKRYSAFDITLTTMSLIIASIPSFVLALICSLVFGVTLKWFPITGLNGIKGHILPIVCVSGGGIASYARMTRATMLEVIRHDYVRTARAKGQKESKVVLNHALINCLIPLITIVGGQISNLFGGSVIVETIFAIPGMGTYMLSGINNRDYPVVTGVVCVISLLICLVNLLVDVAYSFIDPRIKAQFTTSKMAGKLKKSL